MTPPVGLTLSGFGESGRASESVRDHLYVRALAFAGAEDVKLALVSTDMLLLSDSQVAAVRTQQIQKGRECLINHSHTHSGPALGSLGSEPTPPAAYETHVIESICQAIDDAFEHGRPAKLRFGMHVPSLASSIGINRRPHLPPNPDGPYDPTVRVLRIEEPNGTPIACWCTLSAHPTILNGPAISADWPGLTAETVTKTLGCPILFAQGCAGDVMPRWKDDLERTAFTASEHIETAWREAAEIADDLWAGPLVERTLPIQRARVAEEHIPVLKAQAAVIGGVTIVGLNAESFVRIGQMVERLATTTPTLALGYTNGCFGYLPDLEAFDLPEGSRGYELEGSLALFKMPPLSIECVTRTEETVLDALSHRPSS